MAFPSAYHFESKDTSDYSTFYQDLKGLKYEYNSMLAFLPPIDDESCIEDAYLYLDERDLFDTWKALYVSCQYTEEQYCSEEERLCQFSADNYGMLQSDDDSFDYPALASISLMRDHTPISTDYDIQCTYALLDESNFRIIYVDIAEEELHGKSTNIPEEYLPKQLVELRNS